MLHRSGENLESEAISFINEAEEITVFSAYIKLNEIKKLNSNKNIKQIIVRWEICDLCMRISSFEDLYNYCTINNIALYRNTRIHLKALYDGQHVVFGSANVTNKGLGGIGNYNFELNGLQKDISFADKQYFQKIINSSEYVDQKLFDKLKERVESIIKPTYDFPEMPTPAPEKANIDYFLINQLPMTKSPEQLWKDFKNINNIKDSKLLECIAHDLEVYSVPSFIKEKQDFLNALKIGFNNHPLFIAFKEAVTLNINQRNSDRNYSMQFGAVTAWMIDNTTTVPTPRRYEIKDEINSLFDWICELDSDYTWKVPGRHSQVISYKPA